MVVRERCERTLRQRLQTSEAKLAAATTEMDEMRKVCLDGFAVPVVPPSLRSFTLSSGRAGSKNWTQRRCNFSIGSAQSSAIVCVFDRV